MFPVTILILAEIWLAIESCLPNYFAYMLSRGKLQPIFTQLTQVFKILRSLVAHCNEHQATGADRNVFSSSAVFNFAKLPHTDPSLRMWPIWYPTPQEVQVCLKWTAGQDTHWQTGWSQTLHSFGRAFSCHRSGWVSASDACTKQETSLTTSNSSLKFKVMSVNRSTPPPPPSPFFFFFFFKLVKPTWTHS